VSATIRISALPDKPVDGTELEAGGSDPSAVILGLSGENGNVGIALVGRDRRYMGANPPHRWVLGLGADLRGGAGTDALHSRRGAAHCASWEL
jgi:hypothetical protein